MKKLLSLLLLALCSIGIYAKKQVVYVEYFAYAGSTSEARAEQVRVAFMSALTSYQHLQVVDVASQRSLAIEKERRSDEDALEDETARIGKMKQLGANFLVQGYISNLEILEKREYDKKGNEKISYSGSMSYSIKVIDCETGTLLSTDLFNNDCSACKNTEDCMRKMLKNMPKLVNGIVTKNFKIRSIILDSDYESNKGKLLKCYINVGEDDGVIPGTIFAVKRAIIKAGRVSWVQVGTIVAENVAASDLTLCRVLRGAEEIYAALEEVISIKETDPNNAHDLIVESLQFK